MRILWITNFMMPALAQKLDKDKSVIGGWTYSAAEELKKRTNIELAIACLYESNTVKEYVVDGVKYYLMPYKKSKLKYDELMEQSCLTVKDMFHPEVVHIYGTEYPLTLAYLNACGSENVVISIQGIPTIYTRYYFSGMTIWDKLRFPILLLQHKRFNSNNNIEREALSKCNYFEGRSDWDRAISWSFNPMSKYFFCSRTLRSIFYSKKWDISNVNRHTIFLSQAQYPIKGLHQLLKALPFVIRDYPDVKVRIAGDCPYEKLTIKSFVKSFGYGAYIKSLVKKYKLEKYIVFVGLLNEQEICEEYLKANVFVCPSAIENVPNSLAEAQILGTPCIASYVGGNSSLIDEGDNGLLYRFEEYEMLAYYICKIFSDNDLAMKLSINGRTVALARHDRNNNIDSLINIYQYIVAQQQ